MCLFLEADRLKDPQDSDLLAFLGVQNEYLWLNPCSNGKYFPSPQSTGQEILDSDEYLALFYPLKFIHLLKSSYSME